jgi:hypothetical protein
VGRHIAVPLVLALVAGLGLTGCGGKADGRATDLGAAAASRTAGDTATAEASPEATVEKKALPKCATVVEEPADGYRVALPCGFARIKDLGDITDAAKKAFEGKVSITDEQLKGMALYAIDLTTAENVNLVITPSGGATSAGLAGAKDAIRDQLGKIGGKNIEFSTTTVAGDAALRADLDLTTAGQKFKMIQVYTVNDDKLFIWTFTGTKPQTKAEELVLGSLEYL